MGEKQSKRCPDQRGCRGVTHETRNLRMLRILHTALILIGLATAGSTVVADDRPLPFPDLTAIQRERLDRLALRATIEKPAERSIDLTGHVSGWALRHWSLSAREEADAAVEVHRAILEQHRNKILRTPQPV